MELEKINGYEDNNVTNNNKIYKSVRNFIDMVCRLTCPGLWQNHY